MKTLRALSLAIAVAAVTLVGLERAAFAWVACGSAAGTNGFVVCCISSDSPNASCQYYSYGPGGGGSDTPDPISTGGSGIGDVNQIAAAFVSVAENFTPAATVVLSSGDVEGANATEMGELLCPRGYDSVRDFCVASALCDNRQPLKLTGTGSFTCR